MAKSGIVMIQGNDVWQEIAFLQQAIQALRSTQNYAQEGEALLNLGAECYKAELWADALDAFEKAVTLFRTIHVPKRLGWALCRQSLVLVRRRRYDEALPALQEALELAQENQDEDLKFECLFLLGDTTTESHPEHAISYHLDALAIVSRKSDHKSIVRELGRLGIAFARLRRERDALNCYMHALEIARNSGDLKEVALGLGNIGNLHRQPEVAIASYQDALKLFRILEDRENEAKTLMNMAEAHLVAGQSRDALDVLVQAHSVATILDDRYLLERIAKKKQKFTVYPSAP
jgi:tetratricopeptide (TPR) repeat protein